MEQKAQINEEEFTLPELYSKIAIRGFSILFSTIFGGVLLMQNLLKTGKKKQAWFVLAGSTAYTVVCILVFNYIETINSSLTMVSNIAGGVILSDVILNAYIPDAKNYPKKKIWKPLIVSIIICIPFLIAIILTA